MQKESLIRLGRINKAHGLKGELSIALELDSADSIEELESVYLDIQNKLVPFFIESIKVVGPKKALLRLEECVTLQDTARFVGKEIFAEEEYIDMDDSVMVLSRLQGYVLIDKTVGECGTVLEVVEMPGQVLLKIKSGAFEPLIPFNETFILKIDHQLKTIQCDLPEGLPDL
jgi:16S rRNA processing protein RimM